MNTSPSSIEPTATSFHTPPSVPVRGALCFLDAELPLIGTLTSRGFPLLYCKALTEHIDSPGNFA